MRKSKAFNVAVAVFCGFAAIFQATQGQDTLAMILAALSAGNLWLGLIE